MLIIRGLFWIITITYVQNYRVPTIELIKTYFKLPKHTSIISLVPNQPNLTKQKLKVKNLFLPSSFLPSNVGRLSTYHHQERKTKSKLFKLPISRSPEHTFAENKEGGIKGEKVRVQRKKVGASKHILISMWTIVL